MLKLNPYLNFLGKTEEAFEFYKSIFGGEFVGKVSRFRDVPDLPGKDQMSEENLDKVMHIALMVGDNMLMGTDALESQGHILTVGNNISLSLHPDTREEADRLFRALGEGGKVAMPLQDMFWGDYYGMLTDKFGIQWMANVANKKQ